VGDLNAGGQVGGWVVGLDQAGGRRDLLLVL
jgi:hypothetical protein